MQGNFSRGISACGFAAAVLASGAFIALTSQPALARDPWLQPFHEDSIWNLPLGTNLTLLNTGIVPADWIAIDPEFQIRPTTSDPIVPYYQAYSWGNRDANTNIALGRLRLPHGFVVPDANAVEQPNNAAAILDVDGRTLRQVNAITRPTAGGNVWGYPSLTQNIYKKGYYGSHTGSGLSGLGGSIRVGELSGSQPIRHALKFLLNTKDLSYTGSTPGRRWPAFLTDGDAASMYKGTVPQLTMGSLLAISPSESLSTVPLQTEPAKKIFTALQNYGAYVVDTSGTETWDAFYYNAEAGVERELQNILGYNPNGNSNTAFRSDMRLILGKLKVVDNNSAATPGGATLTGTRRVAKLGPLPAMPRPANALDRTGWTGPGGVFDGNLATGRNATGTTNQTQGDSFVIYFGKTVTWNRILLESVSGRDETVPKVVNIYPGSWGPSLTSFTVEHGNKREGEVEFIFGSPQTSSAITFQLAAGDSVPWTIGELNVFNDFATPANAPIARNAWTFSASATASGYSFNNLRDGMPSMGWRIGATQVNGQFLRIDLGADTQVSRVLLDSSAYPNDYSRGYNVYAATQAQGGWGDWVAGNSAATGPNISVSFTRRTARYITIQLNGNSNFPWTIGELNLFP